MKASASHLQTSQGLLLSISHVYVDNLNACVSEQELEKKIIVIKHVSSGHPLEVFLPNHLIKQE